MTRRRDNGGSVTILAVVLVIIAVALAFGVTRVGLAVVLRTRAENAADAAALAAADQLALGHTPAAAHAAAVDVAAANGAHLLECDCGGLTAEVVVELDLDVPIPGFPAVKARSRAEIGPASGR